MEGNMAKYVERYALCLLSIIVICLAMQDAHATAISQVTAAADWKSFTLTINGTTTPDFSYGQSSKSFARAEYVDNTGTPVEDSAPGWGKTDALASILNASGHGYTSADSMNSDGIGSADGINNTYGRGVTYTYRIGYFDDLLGEEENTQFLINASLDFYISHFFDYNLLTDGIGAYSYYGIGLYYIDPAGITTNVTGDNDTFTHYSGGEDWNGTWERQDTLSISQYITGGKIYAIDAFLYTDANAGTKAVVPEPATMLLLGVGMVGLAGASRRKLKK
jgi:hypothetical protein